MLLDGKVAIIFGGSGAIGGAIAEAFAEHGAAVTLIGRTEATLRKRRESIEKFGRSAAIEVADVYDEVALRRAVDSVNARGNKIDVVFHAVSTEDEQGQSLLEMPLELVLRPVASGVRSHLNIARAVAPRMIEQGYGTMIGMTANAAAGSRNVGGFGIACSAIESLYRQLASELSPSGPRFNLIRSSGSPEAPGLDEVFALHARKRGISRAEFESRMAEHIPLRRFPKLSEIGRLAVFLASDLAAPMTGSILNATGGDWLD